MKDKNNSEKIAGPWYLRKDYEKDLKKYLSIYLANIHTDVHEFARYWFKEFRGNALERFCKERGYIKEGRITTRGIKLLKLLEDRRISKLQLSFNIILAIATCVMAAFTIISVLK